MGVGAVHTSAGDLNAARPAREALALDPDHPGILYAMRCCCRTLGKKAQHRNLSTFRSPDHLGPVFGLGNLLYAGGQDPRRSSATRRYCIKPRHSETHNNLANAYQRQGLMELAITHYKTAIEINLTTRTPWHLGNAYLLCSTGSRIDRAETGARSN